jgi:tight adherence protein C
MMKWLSDPEILSLLPLGLAAATFIVVLILWISLLEDHSAQRRLKVIEQRRKDLRAHMMSNKDASRNAQMGEFAKKVVGKLNLAPGEEIKGTARDLLQAGFRNRDAVFIYTFIRLVLPLAGLALGFFLFYVLRVWESEANLLLAATLSVGIVFGLMPSVYLNNAKQKRMGAMLKSLPDALDLFVICAEAGLSLDASFERVSQELTDAHPDLSDEFGLTAVELGFMPERAKALQNLADRCPLAGVRALVSTLVQTERYGTPLATAMRVLSAEMRNERMMKAEEKAARLPAIMTVPMILFILPPLFIVLIGPAIIQALDAFKGP